MKKQILIIILATIFLIGTAIAGISLSKTIPIDDKLDISKSANAYSYETKYYSDGRNITIILKNETITLNKCNLNNGTIVCSNVTTTRTRAIGFARTDEEIKMIIERNIKIANDIANRPPAPTITKTDTGDIILTKQKAEGGITE